MFNGKIYGHARQTLLNTLSAYYRKGYLLFLEIPSIQVEVTKWHATPTRGISNVLRGSTVIKRLLQKITVTDIYTYSKPEIIMSLESSHSKIVEELKDFLQLHQLNFSCFEIMCRQIDIACRNRSRYLTERCLSHILRASSPDCVRSKLFLALYFYRCKRYESTIYLLYKVIQKLEDAEISYTWETFADKYSRLGGDLMSISHGMRKFIATEVPLNSETCIPEIFDEYNTTWYTPDHSLSPWVLSHFLLGLCHFWKGDSAQARVHLRDIRKCLRYRLRHISSNAYPLSWELLGIGQEIIGDFQQALLSYGEMEKCTVSTIGISSTQLLDVNKKRRSQLAAFLNME
ncbi:hypothetical protein FSP39_024797 [Pinctada imbricata]|uniref:Uncharacterized protein n=1 Tax=Pinctada imbricata TaxID=66713 RepID=A0AA88YJZ8_PINIB|nr:hypothetical protein FSP39_024797 [Pinctada imbricata]